MLIKRVVCQSHNNWYNKMRQAGRPPPLPPPNVACLKQNATGRQPPNDQEDMRWYSVRSSIAQHVMGRALEQWCGGSQPDGLGEGVLR